MAAETTKGANKMAIDGMGKDVAMETTEDGGKQSHIPYNFDHIDARSLFALSKVLHEGAKKYGKDNWRNISTESHLNHLISHVYAHLEGDEQDEHLEHAFCRAMMALAVWYEERKGKNFEDLVKEGAFEEKKDIKRCRDCAYFCRATENMNICNRGSLHISANKKACVKFVEAE